jgi:hypothetical protein
MAMMPTVPSCAAPSRFVRGFPVVGSAGARTCGPFVGRTDARAASTVERRAAGQDLIPQEENRHAPRRRSVTTARRAGHPQDHPPGGRSALAGHKAVSGWPLKLGWRARPGGWRRE